MGTLPICCCPLRRQVLCGILDICHVRVLDTCQFAIFLFYVHCLKYILYLQNKLITGRIVEILADEASKCAVIAIDIFQVLSSRHDIFGMPMLARRHDETSRIIIPSTVCFSAFLDYQGHHLIRVCIGHRFSLQRTA